MMKSLRKALLGKNATKVRYLNYGALGLFVACLLYSACMPENIDLPYRLKSVTTKNATKITSSGAILEGNVSVVDSEKVTCGVIYDTTSSLTANSGTRISVTSSGDFSIEVSGLKINTTYYYRAYAVDAGEYKYGEIYSFKTESSSTNPNSSISVTTGEAKSITYSSVTLSGAITGANQSLTCGIIYGTSSSLSFTSGTKISTTSNGEFSLSITELNANTTYYYCAYVIVDGEYKYGAVNSFNTAKTSQDGDVEFKPLEVVSVTPVAGNVKSLDKVIVKFNQLVSLSLNEDWEYISREISLTCGEEKYTLVYVPETCFADEVVYLVNAEWNNDLCVYEGESIVAEGTYVLNLADIVVDCAGEEYIDIWGFTNITWHSKQQHCEGLCTWTISSGHNVVAPEIQAVDLGLSVKWASCNVGASSPEEYGDYFAWGETTTKSSYTESNSVVTYGLSISELESRSIIDADGNLTAAYDAATANWGDNWRMPTRDEMKELIDNCTWKWTTQNGVNGYKVTGPNGNSIFLPAAGCRLNTSLYDAGSYGYYWSATSYSLSDYAYFLNFGSVDYDCYCNSRDYSQVVRPVSEY